MKDLITVATFTIREAVKRKSFIISMIIIIALIIIGFNIPNILDHLLGESEYKENVLIVDEDDIFEESLIDIQTGKEDYNYTISKEALSEEEIKTKLKSDEYDSCKNDDSEKETAAHLAAALPLAWYPGHGDRTDSGKIRQRKPPEAAGVFGGTVRQENRADV